MGGDGRWYHIPKKKDSRNDSSWRNLEPQSDFDIGVSEFVKKPRGPFELPVWQKSKIANDFSPRFSTQFAQSESSQTPDLVLAFTFRSTTVLTPT